MKIGAFEAKNTFGNLLDRVQRGEEIVITRHGQPVARLVPHAPEINQQEAQAALQRIRDRARSVAPGADWESLKKLRDPILGSPTISAGTCSGGSKTNIVPDFCQAEIDIRTIPSQDTALICAKLREVCPDLEISAWESKPRTGITNARAMSSTIVHR